MTSTTDGGLVYIDDIYGGVKVDGSQLFHLSDEEFESNLTESLCKWRAARKRGLWIKVPIQRSAWVPICTKYGFTFHHAQSNYVMMSRWLPKHEPNKLPKYPFTNIGVGGFLVDDVSNPNARVLLIRERMGHYNGWKMPGGLADPDETLFETAQREVAEETGVKNTKPIGLISFRHTHQMVYPDCSDIYCVVLLCLSNLTKTDGDPNPSSTNNHDTHQSEACSKNSGADKEYFPHLDVDLTASDGEVAECKWFTVSEAEALPPDLISPISLHNLGAYKDYVNGRKPLISVVSEGIRYNRPYVMYGAEHGSTSKDD